MVKTFSTMLDLGTSAPDFILPDVVPVRPSHWTLSAARRLFLLCSSAAIAPLSNTSNKRLLVLAETIKTKMLGLWQ
jgi:hypothetical protein